MKDPSRKGLRNATIVFWVLLLYIIAALLWWLISLEQQNKVIHALKREGISVTKNSEKYRQQVNSINYNEQRNTTKYIAEGITFLLLILFGAVYIYRLVRKQFQLQLQQQNFVMAITHELKTPIAVARLNLETLIKHQLPEERKTKLLSTSLQETMRLDALINNILIASQLEANAYKSSKEDVNISSLVTDVIHQFANRYPEKKLVIEIGNNIYLHGDPLLLQLLVSNLMENAHKYAEKATPVSVVLQQAADKITLSVKDEGIGISDEEKGKVFDRFYRIGSEHTRTTKGTGLGLYICKKIAQSHNGDIAIKDNLPNGTNFTVTFKA